MKRSTLDPTAGVRASEIRLAPSTPQRIPDPTDPRYGTLEAAEPDLAVRRIVDPTNAGCGELSGSKS